MSGQKPDKDRVLDAEELREEFADLIKEIGVFVAVSHLVPAMKTHLDVLNERLNSSHTLTHKKLSDAAALVAASSESIKSSTSIATASIREVCEATNLVDATGALSAAAEDLSAQSVAVRTTLTAAAESLARASVQIAARVPDLQTMKQQLEHARGDLDASVNTVVETCDALKAASEKFSEWSRQASRDLAATADGLTALICALRDSAKETHALFRRIGDEHAAMRVVHEGAMRSIAERLEVQDSKLDALADLLNKWSNESLAISDNLHRLPRVIKWIFRVKA